LIVFILIDLLLFDGANLRYKKTVNVRDYNLEPIQVLK